MSDLPNVVPADAVADAPAASEAKKSPKKRASPKLSPENAIKKKERVLDESKPPTEVSFKGHKKLKDGSIKEIDVKFMRKHYVKPPRKERAKKSEGDSAVLAVVAQ